MAVAQAMTPLAAFSSSLSISAAIAMAAAMPR